MAINHVKRTTEASFPLETRGGGKTLATLPGEEELVELELGDGMSLFTAGGSELQAQVDHNAGMRDGLPVLTLRSEAPAQRGAVDLVIKGLKIIGVDVEAWLGIDSLKNYAADAIARKVSELSDARDVPGRSGGPGLYQCDASKPYAQAASSPRLSPSGEAMVMVHGFFSSAGGAFGGLWQPTGHGVRDALLQHYRDAVYCFDHPTLGTGPIANAIELADSVPNGARLHLLAHSRGGLVCELLSRAQHGQTGFRPREISLFEEAQPDEAKQLIELIDLMRRKDLRVERFVRAGSPMRGTWLASNRLDRWLSIFYNVVRHAVPQGPQFVADHVFDVLAAVVKKGLERKHFPGIEAMSPTGALVALLNDAPPELRQRLTVIGGDCQGTGILHRIKILVTDGFFGEPHDLVVPTASMFGGAPRAGGVRYFFHQTPRVDHFHYFSHAESLRRIQTGLIGDDAEHGKLQRLEEITERPVLTPNRAVRPDAPLDVVLPGIMGTELAQRKNDILWVDLGEFACGNFPELVLDGTSHESPYPAPGTRAVFPLAPLSDFYGDLMEALARRGDIVLSAGYDWRKPIHVAADALAARLTEEWPEGSPRPLRLIAHSMGGLVARSLFARHPKLRERFEASEHNRLLMLGTPNAGSMAIAKALLRDNKQIGWISALAPQSETELLTVAATFPGFHELLPQAGRIWSHQSVWDLLFKQHAIASDKRPTLSAAAMALAEQGRKALRDGIVTLPRRNTVYVAGFVDPLARDATVVDIDAQGNYVKGPGDGTVSYASGLIEDVPTYYVDARHGDLPSHRRAFTAYFDLLDRGETGQLPKDWKSLQESHRGVQLEALDPEQLPYRPSRGDLYRGLLGATPQGARPLKASHADAVRLRVVHGGLRFARHPLIVGHYQGDMMQGAEAELDRQFGGQLRKALELGVYPGQVETFQVFERKQETFDARSRFAIVVGLGRPGELSVGDLRRSVKRGILGWFGTAPGTDLRDRAAGTFSVVLLGSTVSGMTVGECGRAILQGVQDAQAVIVACAQSTEGIDVDRRITELELVELYEDKALELAAELPRLLDSDEFRNEFRYDSKFETREDAIERLRDEGRARADVRRLDIRAYGSGRLRFALPGIQAAVPLMKRDIDIAEIRSYARDIEKQSNATRVLGRVLFNQLLPIELKRFALEQYQVVLTLNASAASLPWELADAGSKVPLSVQSGMVRQLRSAQYQPRERVSNNSALVIGEPKVEGLAPLPGARREAMAVADLLRAAGFDVKFLDQPTAVEVRDELGRKPYRIIHFAGHGLVDYVPPRSDARTAARTGMVIGSLQVDAPSAGAAEMASGPRGAANEGGGEKTREGRTSPAQHHWLMLTADDVLACVPQVPELVFINCCHLGRQDGVARDAPQMAANFANSFMNIGCRAVVAAGWAVEDGAAQCFAESFYASMVRHGDFFIDAVRKARECTYHKFGDTSPTWGAYQCYGDPNYSAIRRPSAARPQTFNTSRELEYWLRERTTACMGLRGDALDAVREVVLSVLDVEVERCRGAGVFLAAVDACEMLGAYERAAALIQRRIDEKRSISPELRSVYARVCLRCAMNADGQTASKWRAASKIALDRLQEAADFDNSGRLQFDLATNLRRWFVLQDTPQGRLGALRDLVKATRIGWGIVHEGIENRLGHAPTEEELAEQITDELAQKTLMAIVIQHMLRKAKSNGGSHIASLPDYKMMVGQCQSKVKSAIGAAEFWDDIDVADLKLLLLVTPPALTGQRLVEQAKYNEVVDSITAMYRFATSQSGLEAHRDSIAAYMRFWFEVARFFADTSDPGERLHWAQVERALASAEIPAVVVSEQTIATSKTGSRANKRKAAAPARKPRGNAATGNKSTMKTRTQRARPASKRKRP